MISECYNGAMPVPDELLHLCETIRNADGRALLVGGSVRDGLCGIRPKDWDLEVYGIESDRLKETLSAYGRVDEVGKSFGVMKLTTGSGDDYDFALPRREMKTGAGHKGFEVRPDPSMTFQEAALRRDFTINAIAFDPLEDRIIDTVGGQEDLDRGILRPVSERFKEDPLRVLRGFQMAGRFNLSASDEFIRMAKEVHGAFHELPKERVYGEFEKWASKSVAPSKGLQVLKETGWISHFPEIEALVGCEQPPNWHPEGDVFTHTGHCCDALAEQPAFRARNPNDRTYLMLAMLGHDFGKPATTRHVPQEGGSVKITAHGHEAAGVKPLKSFLKSIQAPKRDFDKAAPIVKNHLFHAPFSEDQKPKDKTLLRLARRLSPASIDDLCLVMEADCDGRPPLTKGKAVGVHTVRKAAEDLKVDKEPPKPFLGGKDLVQRGVEPGVGMGKILDRYFDSQMEGEVSNRDEAIEALDAEFGAPEVEAAPVSEMEI
jgi:tRNA nucleotidyltransferase (CCA-adding enzyme)